MKVRKENRKFILWTTIFAIALIFLFGCKKETDSTEIFVGYWQCKKSNCTAYLKALQIKHSKNYGKFSKNINKYEVVGGQEVFSCYSTDAGAYYFSEFSFDSSRESETTGFGADDKDLDFEVTDSKTLVVTYKGTPKWKIYLTKM